MMPKSISHSEYPIAATKMNTEKRWGLSTCANTKVCNRPVTSAAPAVVARRRKNGMEIMLFFIGPRPLGFAPARNNREGRARSQPT